MSTNNEGRIFANISNAEWNVTVAIFRHDDGGKASWETIAYPTDQWPDHNSKRAFFPASDQAVAHALTVAGLS